MSNDTEIEGKFVWPIPDDGISYIDAMETILIAAEADLYISHYDETRNEPDDKLSVEFSFDDDVFARKSLKRLLECHVDLYANQTIFDEFSFDETEFPRPHWTEEIACAFYKTNLLTIMLLRTIAEWEQRQAKWTPDQLRANPLPAINCPPAPKK